MNKYLNLNTLLTITFLFLYFSLYGHDGHDHSEELGIPKTYSEWIGSFHFIFIHFPIALINMTVIAELLFYFTKKPFFDDAARFMLIGAAIFVIPTALLGYIYSTTSVYEGLMAAFLFWHMWLGITVATLTLITTYLREYHGKTKFYFIVLLFLFLLVNVTSFLGGGMTFGPLHMLPPNVI